MEWVVQLTGDPGDLEILAADIRGPDPAISFEEGEYRLRSTRFDPRADHVAVKQIADELVAVVVDAVSAVRQHRMSAKVGSLMGLHADGRKDAYVFPETITISARVLPVTVIGGTPPVETRAEKVLRLATSTPQIGTAAHFLNRPASWVDLYKVYDALRELAGNEDKLSQVTGVPKSQLVRFRRTADNMAGPAGKDARHAQTRHPPPPNPMTLVEGEELMRKLFHAYVDALASQ